MNKFDGASTRTGYYLRKFLDMNVNANPSNTTNGFHIKPWIRIPKYSWVMPKLLMKLGDRKEKALMVILLMM